MKTKTPTTAKPFRAERDTRLNLLYRVDKLRYIVNTFRRFDDAEMQRELDVLQVELRMILNRIETRFSYGIGGAR